MVRQLSIEEDQEQGRREEVTSVRVYMRHIRQAKLCSPGTRAWFNKYGFNWSAFLSDGIEAERLLETGDPFAKRVVEIARNENVG